jgi:hypothetical protein
MDLAWGIDWRNPEQWKTALETHSKNASEWEKQAPRSQGLLRRTFEDVAGTLGPMALSAMMDLPTGSYPGLSVAYWQQQGRGAMLAAALNAGPNRKGINPDVLTDKQRLAIDQGATVAGAVYAGIEQTNRFMGKKDIRRSLTKAMNESGLSKYVKGVLGEAAEEAFQQAVQDAYVNYVTAITNPALSPEEKNQYISAWEMTMNAGKAFLQSLPTMAILGAGNVVADKAKERLIDGKKAPSEDMTPEAISQWATENPDTAKALAGIETPSRKQWESTGLPRVSGSERARIAGDLREILAAEQPEQAQGEATPPVQADTSTEGEAPVDEPAAAPEPAKEEVLPPPVPEDAKKPEEPLTPEVKETPKAPAEMTLDEYMEATPDEIGRAHV